MSTGAASASASAPSGTTVALGALTVLVIVKFVIHYFSLVVKLTITIYRYMTFVKRHSKESRNSAFDQVTSGKALRRKDLGEASRRDVEPEKRDRQKVADAKDHHQIELAERESA